MGKILILSAAVAMMSALSACNTSSCIENQSSLPMAGLYAAGSGSSISVTSMEVGGVGAPGDSLLYTGNTAVSSLYLPFRSAERSTSFYFLYLGDNAPQPDTITFDYDSTPYFVSEECGAMFNYVITGVEYTRHAIDSVAVTDSIVNNLDLGRIKIFMRVNEEEEEE